MHGGTFLWNGGSALTPLSSPPQAFCQQLSGCKAMAVLPFASVVAAGDSMLEAYGAMGKALDVSIWGKGWL